MTLQKIPRALANTFAGTRKKKIAGLALVAVLAFWLGGTVNGGGPTVTDRSPHGRSADAVAATWWTCSMHPQIKLPEAGKCPICFMDLIPLESGSEDQLEPRQIKLSEAAVQLAQIQTTPVVRAYAEKSIRMPGKITYDESAVSYITARVGGRLDRLYADFTGMTVSKGDPLVLLYSPELLAAQEELLQALEATKTLGNASGNALRSTAAATLEAARDKLRLLGLTAGQIRNLETSGHTSDRLTIHSPVRGVVVHKDAKEGMYVSTGTRIYTIADLRKLWVTFEAYESDLPWLRYGQRSTFTIPSFPGKRFEAVVSFIDPFVNPKTRTVSVRAVVNNDGGRLKPDMLVHGEVESSMNRDGEIVDRRLAGKWISPQHPEIVKDGPGTCNICGKELVPTSSLGYAGGTMVESDAPLLIPATAPLLTGKRAVVYVAGTAGDAPVFTGREIELGPRAGDFYVASSGLENGELVVSNGAFKIDSELQILAKPSMMLPAGGIQVMGHEHTRKNPAPDASAGDRDSTGRIDQGTRALLALVPLYNAYFDVQMSLAKDDLKAAKEAGSKLAENIKNVDMSLFTGPGHETWMELSKELSLHSATLAGAKGIEAARAAFYHLSKAAIGVQETFGHAGGQDYYLTYCPMARDGKGAYWLQTEDVVWNSMYGAKMLRCGSIEKSLKPVAEEHGKDKQ